MTPMRLVDSAASRRLGVAVVLALVVLAIAAMRPRVGGRDRSATGATSAASPSPAAAGARAPSAGGATDAGGGAAWAVDPRATIEVAGRVFVDGAPAGGITVVLADDLTTDGLLPKRSVVAGADGRFAFAGVPRVRGWYRVFATAPGLAPAWAFFAGDAPKRDLELRLERCKAHIYGVVADASGGAIAGARVSFEAAPEHAVVADASGRFELCAPRRAGRVVIDADGYGRWSRSVSARGAERLDATLMPEASLAGSVVTEGDGAAVPFALVTVRSGGETARAVQADGDGRFVVARIAPGTYAVEARGPGAKSKHPVDVGVFASSRAEVTVPLEARARVRGRVVSREGPVAGATVAFGFSATFEWATSVRTEADGAFVVDDAPVGSVLVKIDDWEVEAPKTLRVASAGLDDVTIQVARKGEIVVAVTRRGAPVADAAVSVRSANASTSRTTNAAGEATFRGLADGPARVLAEDDGDFAVQENVQIARDTPARIALELTQGRTVAGRVVDEQGRAVDGARVAFVPASSTADIGASATTAEDGSFRGGPLRGPAVYRAKVTRSGLELAPKGPADIAVPASGPASPREVVLVVESRDREARGVVVDPEGGPVRDARVVVTAPERHSAAVATTFSGDDGSFVVRGLGAGPYAVKATAATGADVELRPVTLPSPPLRLVMPTASVVRGALRGFARAPTVMAWSDAGYDWDFHVASLDGDRFTIAGLSRGRWHVAASTTNAAAQTTVDLDGVSPAEIELVASAARRVRGRVLDFLGGGPLPGMSCQAAPYVQGARSPVVVPGNVFSAADGSFVLDDVPASDLYVWCLTDGPFRGGVARLPADLGDRVATVWGLDVRGKPPFDVRTLGLTMDDDHPFSRRVTSVEPKGAAARAGLRADDVFESVGGRSVAECGNGLVRNTLALLLVEDESTPVVVTRGGATVPLVFRVR